MTFTQNKLPILTTGLSGLVGSTFSAAFDDRYSFENLDISHPTQPVDITNYQQVLTQLQASSAEVIIHLAAFTDVTAAWEQKDDKNGLAYRVNVLGTENIAKAAKETGKHVIHISTAFVFDGTKDGFYTEEDQTNPIEWYGYTKAQAEEAVSTICDSQAWTIFRIDFPFRREPSPRLDIVRKNIQSMQKSYPLFQDHYFGPTYLDDFAKILDWAVQADESGRPSGIFNASSGEKWSDFQLGQALKKTFNLPYEVKSGSLTDYLKTTVRPYQRNTAMDISKLKSALPFTLTPIESALQEIVLE